MENEIDHTVPYGKKFWDIIWRSMNSLYDKYKISAGR
jgi:hypothetical protein